MAVMLTFNTWMGILLMIRRQPGNPHSTDTSTEDGASRSPRQEQSFRGLLDVGASAVWGPHVVTHTPWEDVFMGRMHVLYRLNFGRLSSSRKGKLSYWRPEAAEPTPGELPGAYPMLRDFLFASGEHSRQAGGSQESC